MFAPRLPAETIGRLWTMLAHSHGAPLNASRLAASLGVSSPAVARYLDLLVDLLLVRRLQPWSGNVGKRLVRTPKLYVRASGITHALLDLESRDDVLGHPVAGASWEGFVIENLIAVAGEARTPFYYRTEDGAEVDLVFERGGRVELAIEIKRSTAPEVTRGFHLAAEALSPRRSYVVHSGTETWPMAGGATAIPLAPLMRILAGARQRSPERAWSNSPSPGEMAIIPMAIRVGGLRDATRTWRLRSGLQGVRELMPRHSLAGRSSSAPTVAPPSQHPQVRLAELVAALSLGIDLGFGQPMEHVLRQCMIALRLAECIGLDERERSVVYYTALLINVGCHSDAHEQAKWFGDDIALKSTKYNHERGSLGAVTTQLRFIGAGRAPLHRFRIGLEVLLAGPRAVNQMITEHAALASGLARQLGLSTGVQDAIGSSYEQWDGRGFPGVLKGNDVPIASRLAQMAEFVEVAHRMGGVDAAQALARKRAGSQFDPSLSAAFCRHADAILGGLHSAQTWQEVIKAEPALGVSLSSEQFDAALVAIADFVDLKSPFMLGHARAVADLAVGAAEQLGFGNEEVMLLRRASLAHGLGRLGVSNAIWDRPTGLGAGEWERVRMYPYLTERMLRQSPTLAPLGAIAVQHRERLDGSGYPRGLSGAGISRAARVLGAADSYQAMREPRPYREALPSDRAAAELRGEVRAGRLDGDAVTAVLAVAGHRAPRRQQRPAGLTAREIDVLRLLARGLSSKAIAARLVITPKTARNHVEHIYTKIGATSRVAASLFAIQQGLLPTDAEGDTIN